ncbi:MAG TPA: rod shape-determining protein [Clostridia bacterium]|nr:rod shape-determining protein [Clostridia bacterium]
MGIDLGTANVLVCIKNKGVIANEPSVVAFHTISGDLLAVGKTAYEMIDRTPHNVITIRPLKSGVIDDYQTTKVLLKYFISKAKKGLGLIKPKVLVSVPLGTTQVERKAVREAAIQAGAREANLIKEPIAAAIGAGLLVDEALGNMVVNIGGGNTEVAIISLGGIVVGKSIRLGGDSLNQAIIRGIKRQINLEIGNHTAEQIKLEFGYACNPPITKHKIKGRDLATGLPTIQVITAEQISEILIEPINSIIEAIQVTLERTPPELAADIMQMGLTLTGGGSLLKNLDQAIHTALKIPILLAPDPLTSVINGITQTFKNGKYLQKSIT